MSTAKTAFDSLVTANAQEDRVIEARAKLQNCFWTVQETNAAVQALADAGDLKTIDTNLKTALNAIWTIFKTAQTDIEALAIKDVLD